MRISTLAITFITALFFSHLSAQDIKTYTRKNSSKITTIEPDSIDYSDLEALGNAIGNARVVMLGEQDHGDAPTFLAKTRIIKYLHEKKGFNVLAFESDFFGLNEGWDKLPKEKNNCILFSHLNIFPIWPYCDACKQLFNGYLPATQTSSHPLQLTGFDNQMVLSYSAAFLSRKLDSVLRSYDLPITKDAAYTSRILPLIDSCKKYKLADTSQYTPQLSYLMTIKEQLAKVLAPDQFWMMVIDNLIVENAEYRNISHSTKSANSRDAQMAKNLLWLAQNKYPNEKIIVWAHNVHVSKYSGMYGQKFVNQYRYMGAVFDSIKNSSLETYVLGFTSYDGSAGRIGTKIKKVHKPQRNGFENWIDPSDDFAFTDFNQFTKENPSASESFSMKGHHHDGSVKAEWYKVFNGVFFIRHMYACKLVSNN